MPWLERTRQAVGTQWEHGCPWWEKGGISRSPVHKEESQLPNCMAREIGEAKEGDLAEEMMVGSKANGGQCHRPIVKGTGPSTNREKNG